MNKTFEQYKANLLSSIPVVKGMEVDIVEVSDYKTIVSAPLGTHVNYEGTAFGGSLNTLCIIASYLLVHHHMKIKGIAFDSLVIQNSQIEYLHPVESDFKATAQIDPKACVSFLKILRRKGVGRIGVSSFISSSTSDKELVKFQGRFVASL